MSQKMMRRKVWFHRISAFGWAIAGIAAFPLGWAVSIVFVVIASVYANVKSDWGAAEAADDREVIELLQRLIVVTEENGRRLDRLLAERGAS